MGRALKQGEIPKVRSEVGEDPKHSSNYDAASECNQELHAHPFMSLEIMHLRKTTLQGQKHSDGTICLILL